MELNKIDKDMIEQGLQVLKHFEKRGSMLNQIEDIIHRGARGSDNKGETKI